MFSSNVGGQNSPNFEMFALTGIAMAIAIYLIQRFDTCEMWQLLSHNQT